MTSVAADPVSEELMADSRLRLQHRPSGRHLAAQVIGGVGFLVAAVTLVVVAPETAPLNPLTFLGIVALYTIASRVSFEIATGDTAPILLVVVPALFVLPPHVVPLAVVVGEASARLFDAAGGNGHPARALRAFVLSWYSLGPALVFVIAQPGPPDLFPDAEVYLLALVAMVAVDAVTSGLHDRFGLGIDLRSMLDSGLWVYAIDALLFPVGLLVAFAVAEAPEQLILLCPLLGVLHVFGRERSKRMTHALELGRAYRGTARLLAQVVTADDDYTGAHSQDVVELALAVGDRLGLDATQRRNLEFGALLHDIGKIAVSKQIINKPGPLNAEEWVIIKQHTIVGQRMLDAVGGVLGDAGQVVRSSHERWDGGGYPDGLVGEETQIEARICTACDAFNAMTTDRSYRRALPFAAAVAELRAHAGTQFDPAVVEAISELAERSRSQEVLVRAA